MGWCVELTSAVQRADGHCWPWRRYPLPLHLLPPQHEEEKQAHCLSWQQLYSLEHVLSSSSRSEQLAAIWTQLSWLQTILLRAGSMGLVVSDSPAKPVQSWAPAAACNATRAPLLAPMASPRKAVVLWGLTWYCRGSAHGPPTCTGERRHGPRDMHSVL